MSNLTYQIPEENFLLIKPTEQSDEYYGVIQETWYGEMIKNLSRQVLHSLEVVDLAEIARLVESTDGKANQLRFAGNTNLLRFS